jgi:hypothetical protein
MLRAIVASLLIVTLTACTTWRPVGPNPERYVGSRIPESVQVRLKDGSTVVLGRPNIVRDTLKGVEGGTYRYIPMTDVTEMLAPEPDMGKTVLLATVAIVAFVGTIYIAAASDRTEP